MTAHTTLPILLLCCLATFSNGFSFSKVYPRPKTEGTAHLRDVGDPLIVTPYLQAGKVEDAQRLARVTNLTSVESYSGFFTVNETYNSNMFFWYFPAAFNREKAPVVLWLQGGPGGSSMFGLFVENGPFIVDANGGISFRSTAWSLTHNVVYLDNPVGTGFSFTDHDEGYAKSEEDVADGLYSALTQFFTLFPDLQGRDFYATGESYAGKYVPAISSRIHDENQKSPKVRINLKGMAIGDGFSDPINMLYYGDYLYNIGLLDDNERKHFGLEEAKARDYIGKKQYGDAFKTIDALLDGDLIPYPSYFKNCTGFNFYFNFLMPSEPKDFNYYVPFLQTAETRRSIHVGSRPYNDGSKVEKHLEEDMYQSAVPYVTNILDAKEGYRVLFYNGQLDIIVANVLTENFLRKMCWHGQESWETASRKIWKVGEEIAGYVKTVDNLTYILVRNAGHILPYDSPKFAFDLINRFTAGKPYA